MAEPAFSSVIKVKINGAELNRVFAPMFVDGWVDQGMGVPAAFRLTFRDPYHLVVDRLGIKFGSEVVLTPVADGKGTGDPLLSGEVTAMEVDYDGTGSFTVIRGYDYGHRLMRQRRVAAYNDQTASQLATKLAQTDGVPIGRIDATTAKYDFISQSNVTDWDFIARLADENDRVMSLDAKGRFNFVKPRPASGAPSPEQEKDPLVLTSGVDILRLRTAVTAADQYTEVEARGWDVTMAKPISGTSKPDRTPDVTIGTTPGQAAGAFKKATLVQTATPYDKDAEVKHAAKALAADVASAFAELEVVVRGNPKLRPGVPVALADVGRPFEGKYTTTSVRHVFGNGQRYESWATVSGRQWRSLYGLTSGGTDSTPRLPSVANAVVSDVRDPLKQGRVKLTFPWLDDKYVSDWTRSVQLGGKGGGGIFPMDVGDEVLVGFDRGALDHPFVIGGLYNGQHKPTKVSEPLYSGARNQANRHTLSDRKGNRVDLLSPATGSGGKNGVRIRSGDDKLTVHLDRAKTEITIDSKGSVTIKGSRSVSVKAGANLSLTAGGRVSIKGSTVDITGGSMVTMKAGGAVSVDAGGALNFKAGGAAMIAAGGTVQVNSTANVGIRAATLMLQGVVLVNNKPYPLP